MQTGVETENSSQAERPPQPAVGDRGTGPETNAARDISTLLLLGAGGYVGREVARHFHRRPGWRVVGVFHRTPAHDWCDESAVRDVFAEEFADLIPTRGRVVLLNAAFDFRAVGGADPERRYRFLEAAVRTLADRPSCTCINISSMSAFPGCRSHYGREKLLIEGLFSRHRGINVRPGLITSWERPGSAFLNLVRIVQESLVVPCLTARNDGFFVCDLDSLIAGLDVLVGMRLNKPHTVSFCYASRMRLVDILRAIQRRLSLRRLLLPVPWRVAYWLVAAKERISGKRKVRADSILDFGFPATSAPHRQLFARTVRRRESTDHDSRDPDGMRDDFSFLEQPPPATSPSRR